MPTEWEAGGPQSRSGCFGVETDLFPLSELEPQAIQPAQLIHPPGKTSKPITYFTVRRLVATADIVYHNSESIMMGIRKGNFTLCHDTNKELTWTHLRDTKHFSQEQNYIILEITVF
jgi:hypothetical protein